MKPQTEQNYRYRILKVQLFIQEHLDEDLSLDDLAKKAFLSPFHFHRIFKSMVGESVADYVRRLRLELAASLLWTTKRSVIDVALEVGYSTPEAFARAFKKLFHVSPSQFRSEYPQTLFSKENLTMNEQTIHDVRVEQVPARRVAFLRHIGPYEECGPTFGKLMQWAFSNGMMKEETQSIGISHDDPDVTDADKIRFDCCITVDESFTGDGEIEVQTIEAGEYAISTHQGPYTELGETYRWLFGVWLANSGREPRNAAPYEVYHNNPQETPPEELLTSIYLPLAAK